MIIRIEKSGGSFRSAGKYYLHDKAADKDMAGELKPKTDERVWFTATRNCANWDPEKALDEMWHVAESQQWLKQQVGGRTSGRTVVDPVKTISISWAKEDQPTPDHMVDAADAYVRHMGWDGHQAVYVAHDDTAHRHIHIILNRVNHEHGRTLDDGFERKRSQEFALQYEKEHGKLWCVEREINAAEREGRAPELDNAVREVTRDRTPANQHLPDNVHELFKPGERAFDADEKARAAQFEAERAELKAEQRVEREAWFKDGKQLFRDMRHAVYDAVRAEYREDWKALYRGRAAAERSAEAQSNNALGRAFHFAKTGEWDKAVEAFGNRDSVRDDVQKVLAERFDALKAEQTAEIRQRQDEALKALREQREAQYQELLARQRDERAAMKASHAQGQSAELVLEGRSSERGPDGIANDNRQAQVIAEKPGILQPAPEVAREAQTQPLPQVERPLAAEVTRESEAVARAEQALESQRGGAIELPEVEREASIGPVRSGADLAAGGIGAAAAYVADQMAEFFAPTPPEEREARAKAEAKREAERPAPENDTQSEYQRWLNQVIADVQKEAEEQRARGYWEERDRSKDFGRDR